MDSAQRAQRVHELVEIRLLQNQLRYTKGRRAIIEVLLDHDGPVGIGDIERGAPGRPIDTSPTCSPYMRSAPSPPVVTSASLNSVKT